MMIIVLAGVIGMIGGIAIERFSQYGRENGLYVKGYLKEEV